MAHLDSERTRTLADYTGVLQRFDIGDISVNQVSELDYRDGILFVILGYSNEPLRYCRESQTPINRDYLMPLMVRNLFKYSYNQYVKEL